MPKYEVHFSGYTLVEGSNKEQAELIFKDWMIEDFPEIDVDRIFDITEVKIG